MRQLANARAQREATTGGCGDERLVQEAEKGVTTVTVVTAVILLSEMSA